MQDACHLQAATEAQPSQLSFGATSFPAQSKKLALILSPITRSDQFLQVVHLVAAAVTKTGRNDPCRAHPILTF
jgi:hypothetical protein